MDAYWFADEFAKIEALDYAVVAIKVPRRGLDPKLNTDVVQGKRYLWTALLTVDRSLPAKTIRFRYRRPDGRCFWKTVRYKP